jgi:hypothetical protein
MIYLFLTIFCFTLIFYTLLYLSPFNCDYFGSLINTTYRRISRNSKGECIGCFAETLGSQNVVFVLFEAPALGVDQLCSFNSSGVPTPCIISISM